ncbi:MAG: hypothetical protein BroJett038_17670 [Chloroflexota bacterium]|jgi:hypothetical protein|nr:MAG: hypothetical protein BroJett038_17670 [Chloroflexota bacterium]
MSEEQKTPETKEQVEAKGRTFTEELEVAGSQLVDRVQELVKEGNVRKLVIKNPEDEKIIEMSLTLGAVGAGVVVLAAPWLAALGAIAALVARVKIEVVREEES